jgi:hypothetical protein
MLREQRREKPGVGDASLLGAKRTGLVTNLTPVLDALGAVRPIAGPPSTFWRILSNNANLTDSILAVNWYTIGMQMHFNWYHE